MKKFMVKDRNLKVFLALMKKQNPDRFSDDVSYYIGDNFMEVILMNGNERRLWNPEDDTYCIEGRLYIVVADGNRQDDAHWYFNIGDVVQCIEVDGDSARFIQHSSGYWQTMFVKDLKYMIRPMSREEIMSRE